MPQAWNWGAVDWVHFDKQFEYIHDYLVQVEEVVEQPAMTPGQVREAIADLKRSVVAVTHITRVLYEHVREQEQSGHS